MAQADKKKTLSASERRSNDGNPINSRNTKRERGSIHAKNLIMSENWYFNHANPIFPYERTNERTEETGRL